jgi:hypothetical protein
MLAVLFLGSLAAAGESFEMHVLPIFERLAVIACILAGLAGATGAILAGIHGDTPTALAFSTLFVVATLLLAGLAHRALLDEEETDRSDVGAPAGVGGDPGVEEVTVLLCVAGGIAGLAGAIVSVFYDHPSRALGFAGLLLVAVGLLALLVVRGGRHGSGRR